MDLIRYVRECTLLRTNNFSLILIFPLTDQDDYVLVPNRLKTANNAWPKDESIIYSSEKDTRKNRVTCNL